MARPHKRKGFIAQFGHLGGAGGVAESLGDMTAAWSFLENQLARLLMRIGDMSEESACAIMYAANATSTRIEIVKQLAERKTDSDTTRQPTLDALKTVIALCGRRNALTHHLWAVDTDTGHAYTFDFRAKPDTQSRRTRQTDKSIDLFTSEILEACQGLERLINPGA